MLGFTTFEQEDIICGLILARLVIRLISLVSVPLLLIGNKIETNNGKIGRHRYLLLWKYIMVIKLMVAIGGAIYFLIVHYKVDDH